MNKVFLLAFADSLGTLEQVKECANAIPSVTAWRYDMANAMYLISYAPAATLAAEIRNYFGNNGGFFIVAEIDINNADGWLTEASWHLIRTHQLK